MTTYTVRNAAGEIQASFLSEDEAFAYGSHLADANRDECYEVVTGSWNPHGPVPDFSTRKPVPRD